MNKFIKILFYIVAAIYPVLIFTFLVILKLPVRILSLCVIALALSFFLAATGNSKNKSKEKKLFEKIKPVLSATFFMAAGLLCFFTNEKIFLKLYSVAISVTLLLVFGSTLFSPPNIIFRFALLGDKSIKNSPAEKKVEAYCRKVCIVWCVFFICNGTVSVLTAFASSVFSLSEQAADSLWSIYNGGISYVLMGMIFTVEFIIRKMVDKKMPKVFPITKFCASSRDKNYVLCYEGKWSDGKFKTWENFLDDTSKMRTFLEKSDCSEWILHCEDYWYFLVTFTALLQCRKIIHLTQNITENFLGEIKKDGMNFLTDQETLPKFNADFIPQIIENTVAEKSSSLNCPAINSDETKIFMYTSGSTGKPKAVLQRMSEFELDNAFVISKWADEFLKRKLVTTVSQHHIYGFLFGISLPFALGIPFRRTRIEFPQEFETLSDEKYMIIATPAFLKRTNEVEEKLPLNDCFIFTSGGVLTPEVAEQTDRIFGYWPTEVYGSTETSGIAYRQSKNGLEWTPFDNAKIWKGDDGCLRIISPYIKDPQGFATADLVEIKDDGKFILKGRSDSIVKIEEKRISVTEVENRILETNLVADVKVVALEDKRQYLAAAVELNAEGKKKFEGQKKLIVNRFFHDFLMQYFENVVIPKKWRFLEKIPADVQGKKHKEEIIQLFKTESSNE